MSDQRSADDLRTTPRVAAGAFRGRPDLERLLRELREPVGGYGPLKRWQWVRWKAEGVRDLLDRAEKILARDPELTTELPPGVGGLSNRWVVTDALEWVAQNLAGLLPQAAYEKTRLAIRAAIVPELGQPSRCWIKQARVRKELHAACVAILNGEPCRLHTVSGCESLTLDALGIEGVLNPDRPGRSNPEAHFRPLRGAIGGPFDRTKLLHWVVVLYNAVRVPLHSPDYPDAAATRREALKALAYFERDSEPPPYGVLVTMPGGPMPETSR